MADAPASVHAAPAKVNLWLHVHAPDETGFHPIDTLFCALDLCDTITIEPGGPGIELAVRGADVGPAERNLAYRAAAEFFRAANLTPAIRIQLDKKIPAGAGLGGGSSDAATVLRALNTRSGGIVPDADLFAIAARLGSDVPFFLCGSPLAHATGYGQQLHGLPALPRAPMLVIVPSFGVSTPAAYGWLDEAGVFSRANAGERDLPADWAAVARRAHNDFEHAVFAREPALRNYRDLLRDSGASIAMLSGSGATVFGVFVSESARDGAAARLAGTVRAAGATIISTCSRVVQWQD